MRTSARMKCVIDPAASTTVRRPIGWRHIARGSSAGSSISSEEIEDPADEPRAMWRQPIGRRTVVLAAGSITHFILALVLIYFAAVFAALPNPEFTKQSDQIMAGTTVGYISACFTPAGESVADKADCT